LLHNQLTSHCLQIKKTPEELREALTYGDDADEKQWKISIDRVKAREFLGKH